MESTESVKLLFSKPILVMLEESQLMLDMFLTDEPLFVALFPDLAPPFASNWQMAINTADALPSDDSELAHIGVLTANVEKVMVRARDKYQSMLIYLKMAYSKDKAIMKMFGQKAYASARYNQLEMIELMELAYAEASQMPYKQVLIDKGFTQADIDMLNILEMELRDVNKIQERAIFKRAMATQVRHKALNAVWEMNVMVHDASVLVFKDDYAKLQQYLLYPDATPPLPQETVGMNTKQNPAGTIGAAVKGENNKKAALKWGDGGEDEITTTMNSYTTAQHTYGGVGNYSIQLIATALVLWGIAVVNAMLSAVNLPTGINPFELDFSGNYLTSFFVPNTYSNLIRLILTNNELDQQSVNALLMTINGFGTSNGYIDISGGSNAIPTGQGLAAKSQLEARGWTVITN